MGLRNLFIFVFFLLIASGCSTFQKSKPTLTDYLSSRAVRIEFPLVFQEDEKTCGLAAVDMLTQYYGVNLNDPLRRRMLDEVASENSISGNTLKQVLEEAGYRVVVFPGTLDKESTGIYHHLEQGRPVIVMLGSNGADVGHYCLVSGYDPKQDLVILSDPKLGEYATKESDFLEFWERKGRFTLIAEPTSNLLFNRDQKNKPQTF